MIYASDSLYVKVMRFAKDCDVSDDLLNEHFRLDKTERYLFKKSVVSLGLMEIVKKDGEDLLVLSRTTRILMALLSE